MDATIRILGTAGLVALVLLLPGAARGQRNSCLFTLKIPTLHVFPLMRHVWGDEDMEGHRPRIDVEALIHQPKSEKGRRAKNLRLDLSVRIAEFKGDGTAFLGTRSFWISDRWLAGGSTRQIQECLAERYRDCIKAFGGNGRSEAALKARCGRAAEWRVREIFRPEAAAGNRKWTTYEKPGAKLLTSAECLSDVRGADAGKLGCRNITFRPAIKINVNFGAQKLRR